MPPTSKLPLATTASLVLLSLSSCGPGKSSAKVVVAPESSSRSQAQEETQEDPAAELEPTMVELSVHARELSASLDFVVDLVNSVTEETQAFAKAHPDPGATPDTSAEDEEPMSRDRLLDGAGAMLLASGFGPGFVDSLDLEGRHDLFMRYADSDEQQPTRLEDEVLAARFATRSTDALLQSLPAGFAPQPLGQGRWSVGLEGQSILIEEDAGGVLFGLNEEHLGQAKGLGDRPVPSRAYQVRLDMEGPDRIDPSSVLDGLPAGELSETLQDIEWAEFALDLSAKQGIVAELRFDAGEDSELAKVGPGVASPTELLGRLPANPLILLFVHTLSKESNPEELEESLAELDPALREAGEAFNATIQKLGEEVEALELALGVYQDKKGRLALGIAIDTDRPAHWRAQFGRAAAEFERAVQERGAKAAEAKKELEEGVVREAVYRPEGLVLAGQKADQLRLLRQGPAQEMWVRAGFVRNDAKDRAELEVVISNDEKAVFIFVGEAARSLTADLMRHHGKDRRDGGAGPVFTPAMAVLGSCSICLAVDVNRAFPVSAKLVDLEGEDKAELRKLRSEALKDMAAAPPMMLNFFLAQRDESAEIGIYAEPQLFEGKKAPFRHAIRAGEWLSRLDPAEEELPAAATPAP